MADYVSKLQEDLRTKLDRLSWMHNEPGWYVSEYFAELRKQVDLDAERQLSEIESIKRETGKAPRDSGNVNTARLEFIRILEELEKKTGLQATHQTVANDTYSSLKERIDAFKESSRLLDDLEESYVQLAREIIDESDRTEKRLLGEQTIIYWPHQSKAQLGSLVYFGDIFLSKKEIRRLMSQTFAEKDRQSQRNESSLLVAVRELNVLSKSKQVVTNLANSAWKRFGKVSKLFYVGKSKEQYSGYSAEESGVEKEFISYQLTGLTKTLDIDGANFLDMSMNLFDPLQSKAPNKLQIRNIRLESLHANLLPSVVDRLSSIELVGVHLDSIDTNLLAKYTDLAFVRLQTTFSKSIKFDLAFLGALRNLNTLELSLPHSPSDLSAFLQLTRLRELKLEGSSHFYAEKLPRLSKAALDQILSPPQLTNLKLSCFDIEIIDRDMLSKCSRLKKLTLAKNHFDRTIEDVSLSLGFPLCFEDSNIKVERAYIFIHITLIHSDIQALSPASFAGMTHLRELSLTGNSIADLPRGVFQDLHTLERLDLDKNLIRRISSGVFGKLDNLETLKLDGNPIESIEANAFCQLINLTELTLQRCRLKSIDSEMFSGLVRLVWLRLNDNLIKRIEVVAEDGRRINVAKADLNNEEKELVEKHLFADNAQVWLLDLSGNKVEKIDLNCFSNLNCLNELSVSSNKINELSGVVGPKLLPNLQVLMLKNNQLTTIDKEALPETLTHLHLSKNRLKRLDDNFFAGFTKLLRLSLDENELTMDITEATFASCRKHIEEINLRQNEWIRITEGAFKQTECLNRTEFNISEHLVIKSQYITLRIRRLTSEVFQALKKINFNHLQVCCLSNCSIKSLTKIPEWKSNQDVSETGQINLSWFAKASRLNELDLSRNLIETLDDPELFADFKDLTTINLSNNGLTRIHRNIFKCLSLVSNIDLSGNKLCSIDMGLFRHISTSLMRLNLSSNNITFLNLARLFNICPRLSLLNLADNQLDDRSIAEPIDGRMSIYLQTLNLANNHLEKMDFVQDMTSLKHLDLKGNRIESVMSHSGENLLGRLRDLTHLDLSGNQIRLLRDEIFVHLRGQLARLNVSENPIEFQLDSVLSELI